jgi:hypothetical protein
MLVSHRWLSPWCLHQISSFDSPYTSFMPLSPSSGVSFMTLIIICLVLPITALVSSPLIIHGPLGLLLNMIILGNKENQSQLSHDFLVPCNPCLIPCVWNPTTSQIRLVDAFFQIAILSWVVVVRLGDSQARIARWKSHLLIWIGKGVQL